MKTLVLVVDDDIYNLSVAKRLLEAYYDVIAVPSGRQALRVLEIKRPNLILLDILMPDMDGFELMRLIKADPSTASIPVVFLTASNAPDMEVKGLEAGAVDFISKPFEPKIMLSRVDRSIELARLQQDLQAVICQKTRKLEEQQYEFTRSIAEIVEGRDKSTGDHVRRTCEYVRMIAERMRALHIYPEQLDQAFQDRMVRAAALHDIGKIQVSDLILNKPDKLTDEEYEQIKLHVSYGRDMVESLLRHVEDRQYYQITRDLVCFHHEKWDGSGYPSGLKGGEIPLCARIMAVADVFDALLSARSYKAGFPLPQALELIRAASGADFDPAVVSAFLDGASEMFYSKELT